MKEIDGIIVYAATPFRFNDEKIEAICDFIEGTGNFPFHPLKAMPLSRFNYNRYSRRIIYEACFRCVDHISDEVWIFGIGSGSLSEYERAKNLGKRVKSFVERFDEEWEVYSKKRKYKENFGDLVGEVLESSE